MADFDLLGTSNDETRLLIERTTGYSVPLPGRPTLRAVQQDVPKLDAVIELGDVKAEYGFRITDAPATNDGDATAKSLLSTFAAARAREGFSIVPMRVGEGLRPKAAIGAADASYPLRGVEPLTIEHCWVAVRRAQMGAQVLYRTTRYRAADFFTIVWHHLRTSFSAHHHWGPEPLRTETPAIWPASVIARPTASLDFTDEGWREARAKASDVGDVSPDQIKAIVEILTNVAEEDFPPAVAVPEVLSDLHVRRLREFGRVGDVLVRNVAQCKTAFDFRAWAWQCAWALMNRASAR